MGNEELVDRIYEAALVPELWDDVLNGISAITGAVGTVIFTGRSPADARWQATAGTHALIEAFFAEGWISRNSRGERTERIGEPRFVSDSDLYTDDELENSVLHRDFLRPRGFGWGAGTRIMAPTGDTIVFSSERYWRDGPIPQSSVEQLTVMRPHLARAAMLSSRLGFQRFETMVATLDALKLAGAVISSQQKVIVANSGFYEFESAVRFTATGKVTLTDRLANINLSKIVESWNDPHWNKSYSIPVKATFGAEPLIIHLHPISRTARDVFSDGRAMMIITPLRVGSHISGDILQGLFDLTPAESRVCQAINAGLSVNEYSIRSGLAVDTVRKNLKQIFMKTNTSRQAELIALLSSSLVK